MFRSVICEMGNPVRELHWFTPLCLTGSGLSEEGVEDCRFCLPIRLHEYRVIPVLEECAVDLVEVQVETKRGATT